MGEIITFPPVLTGSPVRDLEGLRRYLIRLSDILNRAAEETTATVQTASETALAAKSAAGAEVSEAASRLRALIQKSATEVHQEIVRLEDSITELYVAKSDFGVYQRQIQSQFAATPENVKLAIGYDETISGFDEAIAALQTYKTETQGYIKAGIVDYESGIPVIGIAIGQNLTYTEQSETIDGRVYQVVNKGRFSSVFTAKELAFYVGDQKTAYFSNDALYITRATVTGDLYFSGDWAVRHQDGFAIKWIGGD